MSTICSRKLKPANAKSAQQLIDKQAVQTILFRHIEIKSLGNLIIINYITNLGAYRCG